LGAARGLDKTLANHGRTEGQDMAADKGTRNASGNDYPAHERNYAGFIRILKISTVITAIVTAVVLLIIAN
jgi:hypothetical protein